MSRPPEALPLEQAKLLDKDDTDTALRLHWCLQQRDYVIAADPWTGVTAGP